MLIPVELPKTMQLKVKRALLIQAVQYPLPFLHITFR